MNKLVYRPMDCPVCGRFYFSDLDETEVNGEAQLQCPICGWKYDIEQTDNPNLRLGRNEESLKEYKKTFEHLIEDNPDYTYFEATYEKEPHSCPVCGKHKFSDADSHEVCPYCGWEDDIVMENEPDGWEGTANDLCLNDYRARYEKLARE